MCNTLYCGSRPGWDRCIPMTIDKQFLVPRYIWYFSHVCFSVQFCKFCFDPICVNFVLCMLICFLASSCHCILLHFIVLARICAAAPLLRVYVFIVFVFIIVFVSSCVRFFVSRCSKIFPVCLVTQ